MAARIVLVCVQRNSPAGATFTPPDRHLKAPSLAKV